MNKYYIIHKSIYDTKLIKKKQKISINIIHDASINVIEKPDLALNKLKKVTKIHENNEKYKWSMIVKFISNMKKITFSMNAVNINQDNVGLIQFHLEHQNK